MKTKIDNYRKTQYSTTPIYYSDKCNETDIESTKPVRQISDEEVEQLIHIMSNPRRYKIPDYFNHKQKDEKDGK